MIYYISDTHFGHEKIINMCNRPYNNIKDMNEDIIKRWNNKVKPEDDIYFLGDFAYKISNIDAISILKRLNGKKHFIKGNHDKESFLNTITENKLVEEVNYYQEINDNGRRVILFHYPIEDWNGQYHGSYHLFGHIHNNKNNYYRIIKNRFNVSIETVNYEPQTLDEIIKNKGDTY